MAGTARKWLGSVNWLGQHARSNQARPLAVSPVCSLHNPSPFVSLNVNLFPEPLKALLHTQKRSAGCQLPLAVQMQYAAALCRRTGVSCTLQDLTWQCPCCCYLHGA